MLMLADIVDKVRTYLPSSDLDLVKKAYVFAHQKHDGQTRRSGEPYIIHPLAVADIIADMKLDVPSLCAALLHDVVEDTDATHEELAESFSTEIADIVDGVTKLGKLRFRNKAERQAESFRKMLIAMSKDIRVILVKLADRLHNMRTLGHVPEHKAAPIARETRDIYAPIANRLGIQWMKIELEDLTFRYLEPDGYAHIRAKVNEKRSEREAYIEEVIATIQALLSEQEIAAEVAGRPKHFLSIYRKMQEQAIEYEQVYDAIAFRIHVEDVKTCYEALGLVHTKWRPIPGRFKDYIALPKPNRYQSLHTSVLGPRLRRMEVQIRTHDMHRVAEYGIAAHWRYKEGDAPLSADDEQKFAWLRQLLEWHRELDDPADFFDAIKIDLFAEEVYVFTPKGDLKVLPKGSTPVDFAYAIHSEVGAQCAGATVGGKMVPLDYRLRSGDTCAVMTRPNQRPNPDWLKTVRTARAKTRIRAYIREEHRTRSQEVGRGILEKALRRFRRSVQKELKTGRLAGVAHEHFGLKGADDLLVLVGYGKIQAGAVVRHLVPEEEREKLEGRPESKIVKAIKDLVGSKTGVRVAGLDDVVVRFSRCCNPVPGDAIDGFITRGRGVAIHRADCRHILDADPDRRIEVYWDGKLRHQVPISLTVISSNNPGLLSSISGRFTEHGINISKAVCRALDENRAINTFEVRVESADQLRTVSRAIERIDGVLSVQRTASGA